MFGIVNAVDDGANLKWVDTEFSFKTWPKEYNIRFAAAIHAALLWYLHLFLYSFIIPPFLHLFFHSLLCSSIHASILLFLHSFLHSSIPSSIPPFIPPFLHLFLYFSLTTKSLLAIISFIAELNVGVVVHEFHLLGSVAGHGVFYLLYPLRTIYTFIQHSLS